MTTQQVNSKSVLTIFLPDLSGGGAERSMVILANALASRGYEVDLVLAIRRGVYFEELSKEVNLVCLGEKKFVSSLIPLMRYMKQRQPYAIFAALDIANLAVILMKLVTRSKSKLIATQRVLASEAYRSVYRNCSCIRYLIMPWLISIFYPFADRVVAVSKDVQRDLIECFHLLPEKVVTIYNPLPVEWVYNQARQEVGHPWFQEKRYPIVIGVGRLVAQKNFGTLIRAFALVLQELDSRLVILGEGEEREELEKLAHQLNISDKVDLPGFDPNPFKYMKRADVFVLSSLFEGLPGVLLQAMALETPVVATDCPGGVREILEDGKWGAIVPLDDLPALAKAILKGLRGELPDPTPRASDFAVEKIVDQYLRLIGLG